MPRIKIVLSSKTSIVLPIHYNHIIQSFIYRHLPGELGAFVHNSGLAQGKRRYKLFVFSRIEGQEKERKGQYWIFQPPVYFYISAWNVKLLKVLGFSLLKNSKMRLRRSSVSLRDLEVIPQPEYREVMILSTLSPITIYSTIYVDNRRRTVYYTPNDPEFEEKLRGNLERKFKAIYQQDPVNEFFSIEEIIGEGREVIVMYKGTVIKGWMGKMKVRISPEFYKIAYNTGLGSKNPQGFGMIEVL